MTILIAIPACWRYKHYGRVTILPHTMPPNEQVEAWRDHVREQLCKYFSDTLHDASIPNVFYRIFYGRGADRAPRADEVFLDAPDDYLGLPEKCRQLFRWALEQGFDYVFKCDDDTGIVVARLLKSGFEQFDYSGFPNVVGGLTYASGGGGYWLSRRAMEIVVKGERDTRDSIGWAEDWTTGRLLRESGISLHGDTRYVPMIHELTDFMVLSKAGFFTFHGCKSADLRLIKTLAVSGEAV
jgi:hypothetical protein